MSGLINYAFGRGIGWGYVAALPFVFLTPVPWQVGILIWGGMSVPMLGVAALARRQDRRKERFRPSASDSKVHGLAQIPKRIGDAPRPSILGVFAAGRLVDCHFIAATSDSGAIEVVIISRFWPYRVKSVEKFESNREWRTWAHAADARILPDGKYADAVYEQLIQPRLE